MAINIKNREAERLLRELSSRTGKGKSQLFLELLRREVKRQVRLADVEKRRRRIEVLARRCARRLGKTAPSPEEIIGYGRDGLPR
ncbi:MAG: type II toxin-antitoxin system VapB family antitoxin [Myxococcales bacterium]|nr:type II toxin-antitoxin system VapB family antitoxin [Myxococcales bacterium]